MTRTLGEIGSGFLLLALGGAWLAGAAAPPLPAPPSRPDHERLRGGWRVAEVRTALKPAAVNVRRVWTFDDRAVTWWGAPTTVRLSCTLDPAASPRRITLAVVESTGADAIPVGTTYKAVYTLDGDTLKIAYEVGGKGYPQGFPAQPAGSGVVLVLKRLPNPPPAATEWKWVDRPRKVAASALKVEPVPGARVARLPRGLSLPVTILNRSAKEVTVKLTHEWHGGETPPTDLYAVAGPGRDRETRFWPAFLYGERAGEVAGAVKIPAGQAHEVAVRMDWPGTGSAPATPLIEPKASGPHTVQLILVFEADGRRQYVVGAACEVDVPAK